MKNNNYSTKIEIKRIKTKRFPKKFLKSKKFRFGEQINEDTGELITKQWQATVYIGDGATTPYEPAVALNLKLGNGSVTLYGTMDDFIRTIGDIQVWLYDIQKEANEVLVREKTAYLKHQEIKRNEIIERQEKNSVNKS